MRHQFHYRIRRLQPRQAHPRLSRSISYELPSLPFPLTLHHSSSLLITLFSLEIHPKLPPLIFPSIVNTLVIGSYLGMASSVLPAGLQNKLLGIRTSNVQLLNLDLYVECTILPLSPVALY